MNKSYATFGVIAVLMIIMFIFVRNLMNSAEEKIKKIEHQRQTEGGASEREKDINALLGG